MESAHAVIAILFALFLTSFLHLFIIISLPLPLRCLEKKMYAIICYVLFGLFVTSLPISCDSCLLIGQGLTPSHQLISDICCFTYCAFVFSRYWRMGPGRRIEYPRPHTHHYNHHTCYAAIGAGPPVFYSISYTLGISCNCLFVSLLHRF